MISPDDSARQTERLENVIATAQRLVKAERDRSKITPAFIAEKVKLAVQVFAADVSDAIDEDRAVLTLIQRFSHWIGTATALKDDTDHFDWLTAARKRDWHYWRRYRDFLEARLADVVVDGLDEATDNILGLLEDPRRSDPWDRRGLVVGHVQSGKTSNYSGLVCKAADAGYKIIIVLAGMHNNLRSQTQMRLEESFLGYETTVNRDAGKPIGVAEFGSDLKTNSATTRAENGDFSRAIARHFHGISPEERPWLFVVKKQKTVLTELLQWIRTRVADATNATDGRKLVTKLPLLMIDDEADNASVDTGEQRFNDDDTPDQEHQPKTINSLIRQILHAFTRKAYVGYTATPFANIFIITRVRRLGKVRTCFRDPSSSTFLRPPTMLAPSACSAGWEGMIAKARCPCHAPSWIITTGRGIRAGCHRGTGRPTFPHATDRKRFHRHCARPSAPSCWRVR